MATGDPLCQYCVRYHVGPCEPILRNAVFSDWSSASSKPITAETLKEVKASIELQSARAEIERLKQERDTWKDRHRGLALTCDSAYRELLNRAFTFLCGMANHFNQPALSKEGKREREEYNALMREMKAALAPAKELPATHYIIKGYFDERK